MAASFGKTGSINKKEYGMCELMGMSFDVLVRPEMSFRGFMRRGQSNPRKADQGVRRWLRDVEPEHEKDILRVQRNNDRHYYGYRYYHFR